MKTKLTCISVFILLASVALAQDQPLLSQTNSSGNARGDKPIAEVTGSYQYDHLRLSADGASTSLNMSRGWDGSVNVPILRWLDAVGDFSRSWKSESLDALSCANFVGCGATATASVYMYGGGPQFTYRGFRNVEPFARVIVGDARSTLGASVSGVSGSVGVNSFFIAPGGGVDIRVVRSLWFRVGADWLHTNLNVDALGASVTVNGVRALGGFKYSFGGNAPAPAPLHSRSSAQTATVATMRIGALGIMASVGPAQGAVITEVFPNGVAALAALHPGDVITAVDGKPIKTPMELAAELSGRAAADKVRIGFSLHGQWQSETVVLLGENR